MSRKRPTKQKSLHRIYSEAPHTLQLIFGFHAFSDQLNVQISCCFGNAADDGGCAGRRVDALRKFAVEFYFRKREVIKIRQGRETCSEIVERSADAAFTQVL